MDEWMVDVNSICNLMLSN